MKKRILVIEDNIDDREWIGDLLSNVDAYEVTIVSTGHAGIDHVIEYGSDCVLIDKHLGDEDGLAIMASLRADDALLPLILMLGQGSEALAATAMKAGANLYMSKEGLTAMVLSKAIDGEITTSQNRKLRAVRPKVRWHVLLVEDNADDRDQIYEMIRASSKDIDVTAVETGTEALAHFRANEADCVILDYRLEAEDGLIIMEKLKAISPFCPVIMLTGQGNEEVAARSIKNGASDYLVKQRLNETYLRTAIENAISRAALEAKVTEQETQQKQFLSLLVHDLRAPLRNVQDLGEMALEVAQEGELGELKDFLTTQSSIASRANNLITTLESYALSGAEVEFGPVSLTDAAMGAKENLAKVISEKKANVIIGSLPDVRGNIPQLIQLFQNLIANGLKYNESEAPQVSIETDSSGNIVVLDNGIGIPEKYYKKIFAPLKRLWGQSQYEGTGLGLATCQKIVERHDGTIWCISTQGEGSEFKVRFPEFTAH